MEESKAIDALKALEEKVAAHPGRADYIQDLADTYADLGVWEKALDAYGRAIAIGGSSADLYNSLGIAYEETETVDKAIQAYRQAIALDPTDALAYHNLGMLLEEQENIEEAVEVYKQGVQHIIDRRDRSLVEKRLFPHTSRTATGQSTLAYRLAAAELFAGGVLVNGTGSILHASLSGAVSALIDILLAIGLLQLRPGARNFALFRIIMGAVIGPILLWNQRRTEEDTIFAIASILLNWSYCGSLILMLTGRSHKWRIAISVLLMVLFVLISLGTYALIVATYARGG